MSLFNYINTLNIQKVKMSDEDLRCSYNILLKLVEATSVDNSIQGIKFDCNIKVNGNTFMLYNNTIDLISNINSDCKFEIEYDNTYEDIKMLALIGNKKQRKINLFPIDTSTEHIITYTAYVLDSKERENVINLL